jgi:hypothetical protein
MNAVERNQGERETEVVAKPARRRFTLEYKRKVVREADTCKTPGAVGALLRQEGLYSSHLVAHWGDVQRSLAFRRARFLTSRSH